MRMKILALILFMVCLPMTGFAVMPNFTSSQIVNNQIQYNYNALDDRSYINGVSTGLTFADSVFSSDHVIKSAAIGGLMTNYGYSNAGESRSFVWKFEIPTGYIITDLKIYYRLVSLAGANTGDNQSLHISVDGVNYVPFASLHSTGSTYDTGMMTTTLPQNVIGSTTFYIKGTFSFANYESNPVYPLMFYADSSGAGGGFQATITLTPLLTGMSVFTSSQIVNNQIQYDYNAKDDLSYINGVSTGSSFANSVCMNDHVVQCTAAGALLTQSGYTNAGNSRSFVWKYVMPDDYTVGTLTVQFRMVFMSGANAGDSQSLAVSTDGINYATFFHMQSDEATIDTGLATATLPSCVVGATTFYIKGTFAFDDTESDYTKSRMFYTENSGDSASSFKLNITFAPAPNTHTVAYWRFEDSPLTAGYKTDRTGNGNDLQNGSSSPSQVSLPCGSLGGGFPSRLPGTWSKNDKAANFSRVASQYFTVNDNAAFFLSPFTVESLVNLSSASTNDSTIIGQGGGKDDNMGWQLFVKPGRELAFQFTSDGVKASTLETIESGVQLIAGRDYYVGFSFNPVDTQSTGAVFYIKDLTSGTSLQTIHCTHTRTTLYDSSMPLTIGIGTVGESNGWDGLIDEVRLSQGQLAVDKLLISTPDTPSPRIVRGFMTCGTLGQDDFATMSNWGADVVRLQLFLSSEIRNALWTTYWDDSDSLFTLDNGKAVNNTTNAGDNCVPRVGINIGTSAYSVQANIYTTGSDEYAGLIFNYVDAGNYYLVRAKKNGSWTQVLGVKNGVTTVFINTWFSWSDGSLMKITYTGSGNYAVKMGSTTRYFTDSSPLTGGSVGLYYTSGTAVGNIRWDNFSLTYVDSGSSVTISDDFNRDLDWTTAKSIVLGKIKTEINKAADEGIKVVLDCHGGVPGFVGDKWDSTSGFASQLCGIWADIAEYVVQENLTDRIWGYDLLNEPLDSDQLPSPPRQWRDIATQVVNAIREYDENTWIIFEVGPGFYFSGFSTFAPLEDNRVVYSAHFYEPSTFTHQGILTTAYDYTYPSDLNGLGTYWDKEQLELKMAEADSFQVEWNVPIYVGEFSCVCWADQTSSTAWLGDVIDFMEQRGWSWTYHAFREFYAWSLEHVDTVPWYVRQQEGLAAPDPVDYETTRAQVVKAGLSNNAGSADSRVMGDANGDGSVDVGDLGILAANYGGSNKSWFQGDFTGDGIVDVGDLGVLAANYGTGSASGADFDADYAKVFKTSNDSTTLNDTEEDNNSTLCSSFGLSLIAGLALMVVKIEE